MNRPTHFEIPVKDAAKMSAFYSVVFQWTIMKWAGPMDYWTISTGEGNPGINGGFMPRLEPAPNTVITMQVEDLDSSIASITSHGGTIVVPRMPIPTIGYLAYGKDPEGNIFGIMQADTAA
jgi:predicted enzyme related to lactoylglutathione lyase